MVDDHYERFRDEEDFQKRLDDERRAREADRRRQDAEAERARSRDTAIEETRVQAEQDRRRDEQRQQNEHDRQEREREELRIDEEQRVDEELRLEQEASYFDAGIEADAYGIAEISEIEAYESPELEYDEIQDSNADDSRYREEREEDNIARADKDLQADVETRPNDADWLEYAPGVADDERSSETSEDSSPDAIEAVDDDASQQHLRKQVADDAWSEWIGEQQRKEAGADAEWTEWQQQQSAAEQDTDDWEAWQANDDEDTQAASDQQERDIEEKIAAEQQLAEQTELQQESTSVEARVDEEAREALLSEEIHDRALQLEAGHSDRHADDGTHTQEWRDAAERLDREAEERQETDRRQPQEHEDRFDEEQRDMRELEEHGVDAQRAAREHDERQEEQQRQTQEHARRLEEEQQQASRHEETFDEAQREALEHQEQQAETQRQTREYEDRLDAELRQAVDHEEKQAEALRLDREYENRLDAEDGSSGGGHAGDDGDFLRHAQHAFHNHFADTDSLRRLWEESMFRKDGKYRTFSGARSQFWLRVNARDGSDAEEVARILEAAGYELSEGRRAPMLSEDWVPKDDANYGKKQADRKLSIDHMDPQSLNPEDVLKASNLRFMTARDNSIRGNRFDADDNRRSDK
ncbi:MAG: hypothetical protein AAFM91_17625 [Pseudomonadota bacterium]